MTGPVNRFFDYLGRNCRQRVANDSDKKQIPRSFIYYRLDIVFRHSSCIYYSSGNFLSQELFAYKRTCCIVSFKDITDTNDNSRSSTQLIKMLKFRIYIPLRQFIA